MRVLQHYYTSSSNEATGRVGFGVKAMSPGFSDELQKAIEPLIAYSIPPTLYEQAIETHPVALRYSYNKRLDESILVCSQSVGKDLNGRPGNFFAHTVVMEPEIFTSVPPIFYWKSPFWRNADVEIRTEIASLPILSTFGEDASLDIDEMWNFLVQGERHSWLYSLLCAVVHSEKAYRRVVILDTTENVVWWIAAVSCLLPPNYRPLLSFATYHHDPRQGQYLITGTTSDSFRPSRGDYNQYFILNAEEGLISSVEQSPYARMAADTAQPDLYEAHLLDFFANYAHRFPKPTVIDEQLDRMALYAGVLDDQNKHIVTDDELQAIHLALSSFEEKGSYASEDSEELHRLQHILEEANRQRRSTKIYTEQQRINVLLKRNAVKYEVSLHPPVTEVASAPIEKVPPIQRDAPFHNAVTEVATQAAQQRQPIQSDMSLYEAVTEIALEPAEQQKFAETAIYLNATQVQTLQQQVKMLLPEEYRTLIRQHIQAFFEYDIPHWVHRNLIAAFFTWNHGYAAYFWQVYWETLAPLFMHPRTVSKAVQALSFWFVVTPAAFAQRYIVQHFFLMLPATFENIQRSRGFQETVRDFQNIVAWEPWYSAIRLLFLEKKSLLEGVSDQHSMRENGKAQERRKSEHFSADEVARLFEKNAVRTQHRNIPKLYYVRGEEQFWREYWNAFTDVLFSQEVALVLEVFSFWFDDAFEVLGQAHYVPQEFFLGLFEALMRVHQEQRFREVARQINESASQELRERYRWYMLIKQLFPEEK